MEIDQTFKMLQQIASAASQRGAGINISMTFIDQQTVNSQPVRIAEAAGDLMLPRASAAETGAVDNRTLGQFRELILQLPQPRLNNLIKILFLCACEDAATIGAAAEWAGATYNQCANYLRKFDIKIKRLKDGHRPP